MSSQLLDLMPIVDHRGWRVEANGWIRDRDGYCPICAFAEEVLGTDKTFGRNLYVSATRALGLSGRSLNDAGRIAFTADFEGDEGRPVLMAALGMTP